MIIDLPKQIACVRREIAYRKNVYPRWIALKKMSQEQADYQIAAMEAVLQTLEEHGGTAKVIG